MRQVDFNELPRATRERFIQCLLSDSPASAPICRRPAPRRRVAGWYALALVALVAIAGLAAPWFGRADRPVQDRRFLAGYVAACAALGLGLACVAKRRALAGALPFSPGVYVFPLDLVDARTRHFGLYPLTDLQSIEAVHHEVKRVYSHSVVWFVFPTESFTFEIKGRERADALVSKILGARQVAAAATQRGELHELAGIDPFAEARARNFEPAHDYGLLAREAPIWARFVWAISVVSGLVLGTAAWRGRNWASDTRAFERLKARPDATLARAYLSAGGLRAAEVTRSVLPRAELAAAKAEPAEKRAAALARFLEAHPGSDVDAEARAAFAEALHAEYLAQTTVAGLRAFVARWPASPDVEAARTKIHELYQDTLELYRQNANTADKNAEAIVEALLGWAEQHEGPIDVRFRRRAATTLAPTDALLAKGLLEDDGSAKAGAPVSPHFEGPERLVAREAAIVRGLERAFHAVFPAEVLSFRAGEPVDEKPTDPPLEVSAPTFVVDYDVGWSGMTYVARERDRRFLGLLVRLDALIQIPKEPRALTFSLAVEPPEDFAVDPPTGGDPAADDERVYDAMILRAFEHGSPRLVEVFLEPRAAAARGAE